MAKEAIGIHSYNTYIKTLNELIDFGFIKLIQKSKNQYSSNIIALSYFDKAPDKALDKALIKHSTKQGESTVQSIDSIIKQLNKEQLTNKQILELRNILDKNDTQFNFKNSIIDLGVEKQIAEDWIKVRAKKKAANTKTAFNGIKKQIEISGVPANECVKIAAEKSWQGLKAEWINNEIKSHPSNKSKNLLEI
jgi:hypothetical protein